MGSLVLRALGAALALLVLLPAAAAAQVAEPERRPFDSRTDDPATPQAPDDAAAIRAADRLSARLGRQGLVDIDPRTGTPRMIARLDGFLTGSRGADPERIVFDYLRAQRAVFGLTDDDLATLVLVRRYTSSGTTHVQWAQKWRGITLFDNGLKAAVAGDGRLINVSGSPLPNPGARSTEPALSAERALREALGGGAPPRRESQSGPDRETRFSGGHDARLVLFADRAGDVRLAWRVTARVDQTEVYDTVVDADNGELLFRSNRVDFVDGKVYAFPYHPGTGSSAEHTVPVDDHTRLHGPNAYVFPDVNSDDNNTGEDVAASSNPPPTWNYPSASIERSSSSLYYLLNEFHDWLKAEPFAFTGATGGFEGNEDRVIGEARDGGGTNNAFMFTPAVGSPRMSMFAWTYTSPSRDSAEDAGVVFHEYAHGLSNRLVTDASGLGALDTPQSEAMGEGWSDWYALDYLADPVNGNLQPDTTAPGELRLATYLKPPNGIRTEPTDCPVGSDNAACAPGGAGGYTYGDFGRVAPFTNEHTNGEMWTQTLWDLRSAIGAPAAREVITDGMRLAPDNPSMLEMRNSILLADQAAFGGANRAVIWQVFAARGMGYFAVSHEGFDAFPREDFTVPGPGTTVTGRVTDAETGAPVANALVRLASTATGFPGDLSAVSDSNGNYRIDNVSPGTYPRPLVDAAGYSPGFAPDVAVPSGGRILDLQLVRNWAAATSGASVLNPSPPNFSVCPAGGAIDGSHTTGWGSSAHNVSPSPPDLLPGEKSVTIKLPRAIDVSAFNIDPAETCGDDSTAATGKYRIETSSDGTTFTQAASGQFTSANNHRPNIVQAPAGTNGVQFVRYTMLEPQSQVDRPGDANDDDGIRWMDTTEVEVYSVPAVPKATTVTPAPTGGDGTSGSGTESGAGTALTAIDRTPPVVRRLALIARQRLRTALANGVKATLECNEPCSARISAQLDARTAKRVKLLPRGSRVRSVRVALGTLRMGEGRRIATLKFTPKARRLLRRRRSLKLSLSAQVTDRSGNTRTRTAKVALRP